MTETSKKDDELLQKQHPNWKEILIVSPHFLYFYVETESRKRAFGFLPEYSQRFYQTVAQLRAEKEREL